MNSNQHEANIVIGNERSISRRITFWIIGLYYRIYVKKRWDVDIPAQRQQQQN